MSLKNLPNAKALASSVTAVYSLTATHHRLTDAISNPKVSIGEISEILGHDHSHSLKVLELANSAFYGFQTKIETVSHAITLIGVQQIHDLVQGTCIVELFDGIPPSKISMESFWHHSITCGLAAKVIASIRHESNTERFFVLGLLHDIGRLVMIQQLPAEFSSALDLATEKGIFLNDAEHEIFGYTHSDVASELMIRWGFPLRLSDPIRCHHHFSLFNRHPLETAVIQLSDIIAHSIRIGGSGESFIHPLHPKAWELLQLETNMIQDIVREVDRQFKEVIDIIMPPSQAQ